MFVAAAAAIVTLLVGDFVSTFFYHVPSKDPSVLLDGFLGAVPYLAVAALLWRISWPGALLGLGLGQLHVWWRHTTDLGWRTPRWLKAALRLGGIVLPEDHDGHHRNPDIEFGDIFRFYDAPARALLAKLAPISRRGLRRAGRRTARRVPAQA
jgi:hypothetical protein